MNFLNGEPDGRRRHGQGGSVRVFSLDLTEEQQSRLNGHRGKAVTVGIRPFAIKHEAHAGSTIDLNVKLSEYLGSNTVLVGMVGDTEIRVETDSHASVKDGELLHMSADPADVLLFANDY